MSMYSYKDVDASKIYFWKDAGRFQFKHKLYIKINSPLSNIHTISNGSLNFFVFHPGNQPCTP